MSNEFTNFKKWSLGQQSRGLPCSSHCDSIHEHSSNSRLFSLRFPWHSPWRCSRRHFPPWWGSWISPLEGPLTCPESPCSPCPRFGWGSAGWRYIPCKPPGRFEWPSWWRMCHKPQRYLCILMVKPNPGQWVFLVSVVKNRSFRRGASEGKCSNHEKHPNLDAIEDHSHNFLSTVPLQINTIHLSVIIQYLKPKQHPLQMV